MSINRIEQMTKIQDEALELFRKKNTDYGDAFATYGTIGVIVRLSDKIQRLISITNSGINLINSESLRDTLIDLHNYAAMGIMLIDENISKTENKIYDNYSDEKPKQKDYCLLMENIYLEPTLPSTS
jgi:hypothetical protein